MGARGAGSWPGVGLALAAALLGLAGCRATTSGAVVDALEGTLEMRGYDVDEVTCPEGLELEDDAVTCEVTIGGETYPVEVTSHGSGAGRGVDMEVDESRLPQDR